MKGRSLFVFCCLLMHQSYSDQMITVQKSSDGFKFTCNKGNWDHGNMTKELLLDYEDTAQEYKCADSSVTMLVRIRTCDNCIELNAPGLTAIVVGNILATIFIAGAVYSIIRQPKVKHFAGNPASDKVRLNNNGDRDTYQPLTPGHSAVYSGLSGGGKKLSS